MDRVNHHMLLLARESRGMTQVELASRLGVSQGALSKYETGMLAPASETLEAIASALSRPVSFFMQPGRPYGFPPFHYRKRKKLSARALGQIIAEMNIRRLHVEKLSVSFELQRNTLIPEIDVDDFRLRPGARSVPEAIARTVRESWMLPSGPIENMTELIEDHGGIVIPCDFGTDLLDAMSQRIDGMPVLFFVNSNSPSDRIRYTLAHELGHMAMHTITLKGDESMEEEADEFAGAFMLPADEIRNQLRKFDLRQLANMKGYWKVSMQAIAYRAGRLNLITPHQSKMFWIEMGKLGYRKREPNEPPREHPKLLRRMVEFHQRTLGYSDEDMAQLLCLNVPEFNAMYGPDALGGPDATRPRLRVVQ